MDFFPAVLKAKYFHWLDDGQKWIKEQFQKDDGTFEISLPMAETVFKNYQRLKSYTKMYRNGLFGDGEFQYATKVDKKIFITAKHPTIPSIEAKILVLEL
jgi:translation elongation factor EF-4